jgi:hypothetical protein
MLKLRRFEGSLSSERVFCYDRQKEKCEFVALGVGKETLSCCPCSWGE